MRVSSETLLECWVTFEISWKKIYIPIICGKKTCSFQNFSFQQMSPFIFHYIPFNKILKIALTEVLKNFSLGKVVCSWWHRSWLNYDDLRRLYEPIGKLDDERCPGERVLRSWGKMSRWNPSSAFFLSVDVISKTSRENSLWLLSGSLRRARGRWGWVGRCSGHLRRRWGGWLSWGPRERAKVEIWAI